MSFPITLEFRSPLLIVIGAVVFSTALLEIDPCVCKNAIINLTNCLLYYLGIIRSI
jgi:hypothetical protein